MMSDPLLITVLTGVILLLMVLLLMQRRSISNLTRQVVQFEKAVQELQKQPEHFGEELVLAEQNMSEPKPAQEQEMPDRYRYVRAMARQGMNAAQIAKILQVGEEEAAQIVRLARLKNDA